MHRGTNHAQRSSCAPPGAKEERDGCDNKETKLRSPDAPKGRGRERDDGQSLLRERAWGGEQQRYASGEGSHALQDRVELARAIVKPRARPEVRGKFIFLNEEKLYLRGVTYGTFRPDAAGDEFPSPAIVARDFACASSMDGAAAAFARLCINGCAKSPASEGSPWTPGTKV